MAATAPSPKARQVGGPQPWSVTDEIERIEEHDDNDSLQDSATADKVPLLSGSSVNTLNTFNAVAPPAPPSEAEFTPIGGKVRTATTGSSIINLTNTIIGAGMLGLPYAVSVCGLVFGLIMLVLSALGSMFGLYVLVLCSDMCHEPSSYYICAKKTFPQVGLLIDVVVFIKCFGVAISYLIVISSYMVDVVKFFLGTDTDSVLVSPQLWIGISAAIIGPLAFLPTLDKLRFTSAMALVSVAYLVCVVVAQYGLAVANNETATPDHLCLINLDLKFFKVMTIFVFGFTCHQNVFTIYNEILNPSKGRMRIVISSSISSGFLVYLIIATTGYLTFGDEIKDNILNSYTKNPKDVSVLIARLMVTMLVIFSYPLQSHPARICLDNIYRISAEFFTKKPVAPQTRQRYIVETLVILAGTYGVSLTGINLSDVLSLVGAIGSTTMCYILPGLFYLKFTWNDAPHWTKMQVACLILMVVGCFVMPTAVVFTFIEPTVSGCQVPWPSTGAVTPNETSILV